MERLVYLIPLLLLWHYLVIVNRHLLHGSLPRLLIDGFRQIGNGILAKRRKKPKAKTASSKPANFTQILKQTPYYPGLIKTETAVKPETAPTESIIDTFDTQPNSEDATEEVKLSDEDIGYNESANEAIGTDEDDDYFENADPYNKKYNEMDSFLSSLRNIVPSDKENRLLKNIQNVNESELKEVINEHFTDAEQRVKELFRNTDFETDNEDETPKSDFRLRDFI